MGGGAKHAEADRLGRLDEGTHLEQHLRVHVIACLPSRAVQNAFEKTRERMPVVSLGALADLEVGDAPEIGVLIPPFVEPSFVVESWEDCDFLTTRFERPALVASVSTFVDLERLAEYLSCAGSLSSQGWGRSDRDNRTVAEAIVAQIEAATQLVLVGRGALSEPLDRCLDLLNSSASRSSVFGGPHGEVKPLAGHGEAPSGDKARSFRVVPPWLEVLEGEGDQGPPQGFAVYRQARPFDTNRFRDWLANPPRGLIRGRGHVWLATEPDRCFDYACAGPVHRLVASGRWRASFTDAAWPRCTTHRRRLLERWHPRFGDRGQELVFAGADLDKAGLRSGLDECLVPEEAIEDTLRPTAARSGLVSASRSSPH